MNDEEDQLKLQSVALQETSIVDLPTGTHDFVCWLRCRRHNWIRIKWLLSNKENFFFTLNLMPLKGVLYVVHKCCITTNMNVSFCPLSSFCRLPLELRASTLMPRVFWAPEWMDSWILPLSFGFEFDSVECRQSI